MGVNKYKPHLYVLSEDQANVQLINGFLLGKEFDRRAVQVLPPERGWGHVLEAFAAEHVPEMRRNNDRHALLLIDFDDRLEDRSRRVAEAIPEDLQNRVFCLGASSNPERLRTNLNVGDLEAVGRALADDCPPPTGLWETVLLAHNVEEAQRLADSPIGPLVAPP